VLRLPDLTWRVASATSATVEALAGGRKSEINDTELTNRIITQGRGMPRSMYL